jgi:hypothetical protein
MIIKYKLFESKLNKNEIIKKLSIVFKTKITLEEHVHVKDLYFVQLEQYIDTEIQFNYNSADSEFGEGFSIADDNGNEKLALTYDIDEIILVLYKELLSDYIINERYNESFTNLISLPTLNINVLLTKDKISPLMLYIKQDPDEADFEIIDEFIKNDIDWNIIDNKGRSFIDYITDQYVIDEIIENYPEKYEKYLKISKVKKFNI